MAGTTPRSPDDLALYAERWPLHMATVLGNEERVRWLLDANADPRARNDEDITALDIAVENGWLAIAKLLVKAKADVAATSTEGMTALHAAVLAQAHVELVQFLLDAKSDVAAKCIGGLMPLHMAAAKGYLGIVQHLVGKAKADPMARDDGGCTALHMACRDGQVRTVAWLVTVAKVDVEDYNNRQNQTPLCLAAWSDRLDVVRWLVTEGEAEVDALRQTAGTALHIAALTGNLAMVQFLVQEGRAKLECRNLEDNLTPLHQAARRGNLEVVKWLVAASAQVDATTSLGFTPTMVAMHDGHNAVVRWLVRAGKADTRIESVVGSVAAMAANREESCAPDELRRAKRLTRWLARKCCRLGCVARGAKKCGRCEIVYYCGGECQRADWPRHRLEC